MEAILGGHIDERDFHRFLADWRATLTRRIEDASAAISAVPGVAGLILAGSNGIGSPWPLSDIDLLWIYEDCEEDAASAAIDEIAAQLMQSWAQQGWRTGLDIGRLRFSTSELAKAFSAGDPDPLMWLQEDQWYYAMDKGYGGRALHDGSGLAEPLARWFTKYRFGSDVVAFRRRRSLSSAQESGDAALEAIDRGEPARAWSHLLKAVQWFQISLMEGWGERDNSLGRFGTRLERAAERHNQSGLIQRLNVLCSLDHEDVPVRLSAAPWWVLERRDRAWISRQAIAESVTMLQNDRDVLRVSTDYQLRLKRDPPFADWLAIPPPDALRSLVLQLQEIIASYGHHSDS